MPNFVLLDINRSDIACLLAAMLQAREAVGRRSWSHPQEPASDDWWADVLADPRARWCRRVEALQQDAYRLSERFRRLQRHSPASNSFGLAPVIGLVRRLWMQFKDARRLK